MTLRNEHIALRKLEIEDLPMLYLWENDTSSWKAGDTHNPLSHKDLRDYIESSTGDIYSDRQLRLIISSAADSSALGCIDIFDFDPHNRKAALGLYVHPACRQQHIATMAVRLLLPYLFDYLKLNMVYSMVQQSNIPSNQLFQSLHFQHTATLIRWHNNEDVFLWQYMQNQYMNNNFE